MVSRNRTLAASRTLLASTVPLGVSTMCSWYLWAISQGVRERRQSGFVTKQDKFRKSRKSYKSKYMGTKYYSAGGRWRGWGHDMARVAVERRGGGDCGPGRVAGVAVARSCTLCGGVGAVVSLASRRSRGLVHCAVVSRWVGVVRLRRSGGVAEPGERCGLRACGVLQAVLVLYMAGWWGGWWSGAGVYWGGGATGRHRARTCVSWRRGFHMKGSMVLCDRKRWPRACVWRGGARRDLRGLEGVKRGGHASHVLGGGVGAATSDEKRKRTYLENWAEAQLS
ncbi:hypothetical protein EDB85DRAFT_1897214 [Lactarius pseudohatsudake]|nr:hypothetical protein EDB85DRAFT_1897214 [Lactarius pseudohatsudake]